MVQKSVRPRGRPRSFDEQEALERAIQVFWARGYDGVTIDDLVAGMGVGRPSLYAVFGDKQTLFMRCLEGYAQRHGALAAEALLGPAHVRDAVAALLRYSVESATRDGSAWGCLMVCVAPLVDDARVRDFLARAQEQTMQMIETRLRDGIEAGELPRAFPAATRARQIVDLSAGLTVRARTGALREALLADADAAAALLVQSERA